jgi:hypothetical protein
VAGYPPSPDTAGLIRGLFSQPDSTYGPSMLIDMEDGRTTEGEHTIGDLVERAARVGANTPILSAALCNLQAYESTAAIQIRCNKAIGLSLLPTVHARAYEGLNNGMSVHGSAPRRRGSLVEEDSTQRVVD